MEPDWLAEARRRGLVATEGRAPALPGAPPPPPDCSEAEFLGRVVDLARAHHWAVAHFRPGLTRRGAWATAVQGDGKGFPDLVLVRERVLFAELKSAAGRPTSEQRWWLTRLMSANAGYFLWRPADWDDVARLLSAPAPGWWLSLMRVGEGVPR